MISNENAVRAIFWDAHSVSFDNPSDRKKFLVLVFLIRFIFAAIPLYFVMEFVNLYPIQIMQAHQVYAMLDPSEAYLDPGADIGLPLISIFGWSQPFGIDSACTGYRSLFALMGLIFATPNISRKKKLAGFLLSMPILWVVNIWRIYITITLSAMTQQFNLIHGILWTWGLTIFIVIYWLVWLKVAKKYNKQDDSLSDGGKGLFERGKTA